MLRRWIRRRIDQANAHFDAPWAVVRFQPILYLFLFGASIRLWFNDTAPPNFDDVIGHGFYGVWLGMAVTGPLLALLAWLLISKGSGRSRFIGIWTRTAADMIVLVVLLSYHVVTVTTNPANESRIFSRYMVGAATMFVIGTIIRDIWTLVITERLAGRIHRGDT